ncbi:MAG: hypothetical protein ABIH47_10515 [Candidatus Omnitrophota bacterium]
MAGTGLRFLPLLFVIPTVVLYIKHNTKRQYYLLFVIAFCITFTFNIPHLFFHGFHSLGETTGYASLLYKTFTQWVRTPFVPFPNIFFYLVNIVNYFGYGVSGIIIIGFLTFFKDEKITASAFASIFFAIVLVLSFQRNWIEGDKYRIITVGFLPLYVYLGYGVKYVWNKKISLKKIFIISLSVLVPYMFTLALAIADYPEDSSFYVKKYLYQKETKQYYLKMRQHHLDVSVAPNYKRLFFKRELQRKTIEERIAVTRLFPTDQFPYKNRFNDFYAQWGRYFQTKAKQVQNGLYSYRNIEIDFNQLVDNTANAIRIIDAVDNPVINFEQNDEMFNVYYAGLDVKWQKEKLPVCILVNNNEIELLNELYIELNAFKSYGKNNAELDVINVIRDPSDLLFQNIAMRTGMKSFPLFDENNKIVLRVPNTMTIVIRNWFIDGADSTPYKIDGWLIRQLKDRTIRIEYLYNEPESYL